MIRRLCLSCLFIWMVVGCTPNRPWRTAGLVRCADRACDTALIEQHEQYDLAFVEFTERGNVFSRQKLQDVLQYVTAMAQADDGVMTIVFVHGWKHNAQASDTNVQSFRDMLRQTATLLTQTAKDTPGAQNRRVVGIYIGWRGKSLDLGLLTNLSYWDRKAVAHQVGKGGVTELLLRLEHAILDAKQPNKNLYLVVGHSFGGAIVLSALNEILLERVVTAEPLPPGTDPGPYAKPGCQTYVKTHPFGHGVILLNPAIEANEALQLKERVSHTCFASTQDRLLHVISSDADEATNTAFRFGQWLGISLTWRETRFERTFDGKTVQLREADLDRTTVGNYMPFRTGKMEAATDANASSPWTYRSCVGKADCVEAQEVAQHIPVAGYEPLAFIQTDATFIADHNDIFNQHVAAYLAAVIAEARYRRIRATAIADEHLPPPCLWPDGGFNFGGCFSAYLELFNRSR